MSWKFLLVIAVCVSITKLGAAPVSAAVFLLAFKVLLAMIGWVVCVFIWKRLDDQ